MRIPVRRLLLDLPDRLVAEHPDGKTPGYRCRKSPLTGWLARPSSFSKPDGVPGQAHVQRMEGEQTTGRQRAGFVREGHICQTRSAPRRDDDACSGDYLCSMLREECARLPPIKPGRN